MVSAKPLECTAEIRRVAFGPFHFDPRTRLLYRGAEEVPVPPRAAALLGHLLARAGEVVTREELLDTVWADTRVGDASLKEAVHVLRQALDDRAKRANYIQTLPRRGYRFIAAVRSLPATAAAEPIRLVAMERRRAAWLGVVGGLAVATVGLLIGTRLGSGDPAPPMPRSHRFSLTIPGPQRLSPGPANLALSPDGRQLVFAAKSPGSRWQLYRRPTDALAVRAISGTEGGRAPFFSPDGETLAFFTTDALRTVALASGTVRTVCTVEQGLGGAWIGDRIVFSSFERRDAVGLWSVPARGGRPQVLTTRGDDEAAHRWPAAINDQTILYTVWRTGLDDASVAWLDLASGTSGMLVEGAGFARPMPGYLLFARPGELLSVSFDANRRAVTGAPVSRLRGLATTPVWGTAHYAVSTTGSLVYMPAPPKPRHRLVRIEPGAAQDGRHQVVADIGRAVMDLRRSLDGRHALVTTQGAALDLWTIELDRGAMTRLTDDGTSHGGVFSTEGSQVFYASRQDGHPGIYRRATAGGDPELIYASAEAATPCAVAMGQPPEAEGRELLLIAEWSDQRGWDVVVLDPASGAVRPFLATPFDERHATLSPDGTLVAYESNETGVGEVYLRRFPDGAARWPVSAGGGSHPLFAADSSEIFFRRRGEIFAAPLDLRGPQPRIGSVVRRLAGPDLAGHSMAPHGDGVLLVDDQQHPAEEPGLVFVVNFSSELQPGNG